MTYGTIYGLYDPQTHELRYVGQTTLTPEKRLTSHLSPKNLQQRHYSARWIKSLLNKGLRPELRVLHTAFSREELDALEVDAIAQALATGARLTNHSEGGGGIKGFTHTPETKARMSASRMGHLVSAETRAKIGDTHRGLQHSPEAKRAISAAKKAPWVKRLIELADKMPLPQQIAPTTYHRSDLSTVLILRKMGEGKTAKEVAAELGISKVALYYRLRQFRGQHGQV